MSTAVYPGSFDPITNGHLGLIKRGLEVFDRLIIAVALNVRKEPCFSIDERLDMIRDAVNNHPRCEIDTFEGLTINYAADKGANVILRGLRAVADFEYELQMANMNKKLNNSVETMFMMTEEEYFFVSSKTVKEVASLKGSVKGLVPPIVTRKLAEKFGSPVD